MAGKLPLNLDDLLRQRTVEGDRIEYKKGWNPDAVVRTLCAFANDFGTWAAGTRSSARTAWTASPSSGRPERQPV